ncbi:hypothetical protein GCM10023196_031420 [Actinoallomurus vinaceus]|uniref:Uncharacterized protein n=1 Tax=Actinoallomurus vinaceus TaxID=1080074 RepID=A0ABP8UAG3_9ACTN
MGFNQAQYDAVVEKVRTGIAQIGAKNQQVIPAATHATSHWYLPDGVKSAVLWMAKKLTQLSEWLIRKAGELLAGFLAPVGFMEAGWKWQDVKAKASTIEGAINPDQTASSEWDGSAKDHYRTSIKPQQSAAGRIKTVAGSISTSLYICAGAGLAFYAALGLITYQFLTTLGAALAALFSGVLSLPGFVAAVADCGVTAAAVITAVAGLGAFLSVQAQQMGSLHGEAKDNASFPGGHWPRAVHNA